MMALDQKLTFNLPTECEKTAKILQGFLHAHPADTDVAKRRLNTIPKEVISNAHGLCVMTVWKGTSIA